MKQLLQITDSKTPSPPEGEGWGEGCFSHKYYSPKSKLFARNLRKRLTEAEKIIWKLLRNNNLEYKFRRQFSIDNKYILDFVCLEKKVIIEIDGGQHNENKKDKIRDSYLKKLGFTIIRLWNNEVLENLDGCFTKISEAVNHPSPANHK